MKMNKFMKSIALLLAVILAVQMSPIQSLAEGNASLEALGIVGDQEFQNTYDFTLPDAGQELPYNRGENTVASVEQPTIEYERTDLREQSIKYFQMSDGSTLMALYSQPVHYQDEQGQWQDIQSTLRISGSPYARSVEPAGYETVQNSFKTKFAGAVNNQYLVKITKDEYEISWNLTGANGVSVSLSSPSLGLDAVNNSALLLHNLVSQATYADILPHVDAQYMAVGDGIKENLIVKTSEAPAFFTYQYNTPGLSARQIDSHTIEFYDPNEPNEAVYTLSAPYMRDSALESCDQVDLSFWGEDGSYTVTVTPDAQWMRDPARVYPIVIDPEMQATTSGYEIYDTFVNKANPNKNYYLNEYSLVGKNQYGPYRTFTRFALPTLPEGSVITKASFNLYEYDYEGVSAPVTAINAYRTKQDVIIDNQTLTWNNSQNVIDYSRVYDTLPVSTEDGWRSFNVTDIVRGWYEGDTKSWIALQSSDETAVECVPFYTGDVGYAPSSMYPQLVLTYVDPTGLEDYWTFHGASDGKRTSVYVDDYNGQLVAVHTDIEMNGQLTPISISHVLNGNGQANLDASDSGLTMKVGKGFRLNIHERVLSTNISSYPFKIIDADGTDHYFTPDEEKESQWVLEDDSSIKLTQPAAGRTLITYADGSTKEFNASGYLTKITDNNGNSQVISYENGKISYVQDGAGRRVTFGYNAEGYLTSLTDPAGRSIQYGYTAGRLTTITDPDNIVTTFVWSEDFRPSSIRQEDGSGLSISYENGRVSQICQLGKENQTGAVLNFAYSPDETTVSDSNGKSETMLFDQAGRTVCVRDQEGNAVFGGFGNHGDTKNKLLYQSSMQQITKNLLDPSQSSWTAHREGDTTGEINFGSAPGYVNYRYLSDYTLRLMKSSQAGSISHRQTVDVQGGKSYTFSAYAKLNGLSGDGGAYLQMEYTDAEGQIQSQKTPLFKPTDFTRNFVTMDVPAGVSEVTVSCGLEKAVGTVHFSAIQLEENTLPSLYNILGNGTLEYGSASSPTGWVRSSDCGSNDIPVTLEGRGGTGMKLTGEPRKQKRLSQTLSISGSQGDTFVLSGFAKGYAVPNDQEAGKIFGLSLTFYYTDGTSNTDTALFESSSTNWQMTSGEFAAEKSFSSIKVEAVYDGNTGTATFDDLQLNRTLFGTEYIYDSDGKVLKSVDRYGDKVEYTYTGEDVATEVHTRADGTVTVNNSYEYDGKHNLKKETDHITGTVQEYTLDEKGNLVAVESQTGGQTTESNITYTEDKNYPATETDAFGQVTYYNYDTLKGVLHSITDAKNNTTSYTYDPNTDAVTSVSGNAQIGGENGTISNQYAYQNGRLATISSNGTNYHFVYDAFGNSSTAKVGNQVLISHSYSPSSGLLLQSTYGNGATQQPVYDSLDRVVGMKYNGVEKYQWQYAQNGNLSQYTDNVNGLKFSYRYDDQDRVIETNLSDGSRYQYAYNSRGGVEATGYTIGGTQAVTTYGYDAQDRLSTLTMPNNAQYGYEYDGSNVSRQTITMPSTQPYYRWADEYSYATGSNGDATDRIQQITHKRILNSDGSTKWSNSISYTYDAIGNIQTISENGVQKAHYTYDAQGQLIRENNGYTGKTVTYTYDAGGNLLNKKEYAYTTGNLGAVTKTVTYSYGDSDWKDKLTSFDGKPITYDAIGNPLSYDGWSYTWEHGHQLSGMSKGDTSIGYQYDADGLRTEKTVDGVTTKYYWDGDQLIYQTDGTLSLRFYYDPNGEVVSFWSSDGGHYYYEKNAQGDITGIINMHATEVAKYTYDSWGNVVGITDGNGNDVSGNTGHIANQNPLRYRGYYYDKETGYYYLQSRYYNPSWGRFLNADALIDSGHELLGHNLFAYCNNDPVNHVDNNGEKAINITSRLDSLMRYNARWLANYTYSQVSRLGAFALPSILKTFVNKVKSGGAWDLKRLKSWQPGRGNYYVYRGKKLKNDDPGNIHFGYVGSVLFPVNVLCAGAGLYQIKSGTSKWRYFFSFFDDPRDSSMIRLGNRRYYADKLYSITQLINSALQKIRKRGYRWYI